MTPLSTGSAAEQARYHPHAAGLAHREGESASERGSIFLPYAFFSWEPQLEVQQHDWQRGGPMVVARTALKWSLEGGGRQFPRSGALFVSSTHGFPRFFGVSGRRAMWPSRLGPCGPPGFSLEASKFHLAATTAYDDRRVVHVYPHICTTASPACARRPGRRSGHSGRL